MKTKRVQPKPEEFHLKFLTADGNLVMDRVSDRTFYFDRFNKPTDFINYSLGRDAIEKGVRIINKNISLTEIACTVEWL